MNTRPKRAFMSVDDRTALAWLWRCYLRRYIWAIAGVSGLVIIYGLALVWILNLLNANFASLFSTNQGLYEFSVTARTAHAAGESIDQDRDGIYEFQLELQGKEEQAPVLVPLLISIPGIAPQDAQDVTVLDASLFFDDQAEFQISSSEITEFIEMPGLSLTAIQGLDAAHIRLNREGAGSLLWQLFAILICATLLRVFSAYLSTRIAAQVTARAAFDIRHDLIGRLMSLDLAYFDQARTGGILLVLNDMVKGVQSFFSSRLLNAARAAVTIFGIMGYLAYVHFGLFLFIALIFPLAFIGVREVSNRLRAYMESGLAAFANYLTDLENSVSGIRTIKLTNQSQRAEQTLIKDAAEIAKIQIRMSKYIALISPIVDLLAALAIMGIVLLGGLAVINGWFGLTGSTLITFVIGLALIFSPASRLSGFQASILRALVALGSLHKMSQKRPRIVDAESPTDRFDTSGPIEFSEVTFSYATGSKSQVFQTLNLRFEGGKISALVGQTGSGKTTILSLLSRLYDVNAGEIRIGGTDIRQIRGTSLRDAFSVVTQDVFLFDDTILENIRFVNAKANDEQVLNAAAKAQLSALITEKGKSTIGPRGTQLSGGQKQRIAIARAFLKDAPIVLLDEATSALDQKTESKITRALRELCEGKTTLIIAHRLSTIAHADEIFVLERGEVVERGSHGELMARSGLYSALYSAQQSGVEIATQSR